MIDFAFQHSWDSLTGSTCHVLPWMMIFTSSHHDIQQSCFQNPIPPPPKKKEHTVAFWPQIWTYLPEFALSGQFGPRIPWNHESQELADEHPKAFDRAGGERQTFIGAWTFFLANLGHLANRCNRFNTCTIIFGLNFLLDHIIMLSYLHHFVITRRFKKCDIYLYHSYLTFCCTQQVLCGLVVLNSRKNRCLCGLG